jgi:hypothetical protein
MSSGPSATTITPRVRHASTAPARTPRLSRSAGRTARQRGSDILTDAVSGQCRGADAIGTGQRREGIFDGEQAGWAWSVRAGLAPPFEHLGTQSIPSSSLKPVAQLSSARRRLGFRTPARHSGVLGTGWEEEDRRGPIGHWLDSIDSPSNTLSCSAAPAREPRARDHARRPLPSASRFADPPG